MHKRVGILGCTGMVGQRMIHLLEGHPVFRVHALGASSRSSGQAYGRIPWRVSASTPSYVRDTIIRECDPEQFDGCDLVLSALDSSVAGDIEQRFASRGVHVFSNASNHRMHDTVPLVTPFVNHNHIDEMASSTVAAADTKQGMIVTNANCTTAGVVTALSAIDRAVGVDAALLMSMQAVSGAGYPGVSSVDMIDNVVPYIGGEEEKLETELNKILGRVTNDGRIQHRDIAVSAHCNRVPVLDGHTVCVSVRPTDSSVSVAGIVNALRSYTSPLLGMQLHSLSHTSEVIAVRDEPSRPQPRLDRDAGNGFTTTVGRVRECPILGIRFVLVSHNTLYGAAGGALLNAEYAVSRGLV